MSSTVQSLTLPRLIAAALARHCSHAFGLMGNGNAHFIEALREVGIPLTTVRHEAATVASADAYTRVSGRVAIATTTYGAGFTNTVTALAEAAQARTPMFLVVGDSPTSGARPWDVDQEMLAAAVGVRTYRVDLANPAKTVDRAIRACLRHRRPVVLSIPYDLVARPLPDEGRAAGIDAVDLDDPATVADLIAATRGEGAAAPERIDGAGREVDPLALERAVAALATASRPAIIAGHGAWLADAGRELGRLADALGALTASTARGRGIFPDARHDLGIVGGFGQERAMETLSQADVVVVVGAGLNQFTMRFGELLGPDTTLIRVDIDEVPEPRTAHPLAHLLLVGDAREVVSRLADLVAAARPTPSGWREATAGLEPGGALRALDTGTDDAEGLLADGRLDPRALAARLAELLPVDRHVTSDGGHFLGWANMFWPVASPERMLLMGTMYQTIGLGLASASGVAIAAPDSTLVVNSGDGGGLMALADLETVIRTARRCVIVIWNDGAYSAEVHLYGRMGINEEPMRIPEVNFAGLAAALGATGLRIERLSDLAGFERWLEAGGTGTVLLDCRISGTVIAPYQREIMRVNGVE